MNIVNLPSGRGYCLSLEFGFDIMAVEPSVARSTAYRWVGKRGVAPTLLFAVGQMVASTAASSIA